MIGSDMSVKTSIIASIIAAALARPEMVSGAGGAVEGKKCVGLVISGPMPPGGGGSKTGGGSVGLIGPSGV
jgi:hypothetical protein